MDDLISRSELLKSFDIAKMVEYDETGCGVTRIAIPVDTIKNAPTVNALKLPCSIGCEVYSIEPIWYYHELHKGVHRGKVVGIEVNAKKHKMVWIHLDLMSEGSACAMDFEDFGKKIFFSKDEAWSALNQEDAHAAD